MSNTKFEDYLQECMDSIDEDLSVEAFQKACCSICLNSECKRSGWGESNWLQRMKRQENSLYNPTFYDPGEYEDLANQDFLTIDNEQSKVYGGWVNVKEDGTIVHHGEEETKEREADKIDESVQSLRSGSDSKDAGEDDNEEDREPETQAPEKEENEQEPEPQKEPEAEQSAATKKEVETKTVSPKHFTAQKNTKAPTGGIMLDGDGSGDARHREESELVKQSRKWEVTEKKDENSDGGGGNLTVRIDSGEVIDKD